MTIAEQKTAMRAEMLARRAAFDPAAGNALATLTLSQMPIEGGTVAGVWPLPGEMDLRPLIFALHARGYSIVLPETPARGLPLVFRAWHPGCAMIRERFGTYRPDGPVGDPEMVFVPLLAFDRRGGRLGYGGGYYDRTLSMRPGVIAAGFGYAAQEVSCVPMDVYDRRLGVVFTETGRVLF